MKKITLFTILFVVSLYLSPLICAQMDDFPLTEEEQAYILAYTYLDTRFSMGGPETESEISRFKEIASTLSAAQREDLYDKYKYPTATTIGLNVLTGGLGSIINDDNKIPGLILQLCGSAGFGLVLWAQFSQDPDLDTISVSYTHLRAHET